MKLQLNLKFEFCTIILVLLFVSISSATSFAVEKINLTNQKDVQNVLYWKGDAEFYYCLKNGQWFTYNIKTNHISGISPNDGEKIESLNKEISVRFTGNRELEINYCKKNITKRVSLPKYDYSTDIVSVSDNGKNIGLGVIAGPFEDENTWIILNTQTLETTKIPFEKDEYSYGTISWSTDDRYCVVDIAKTKPANKEYDIITQSGILIFDLNNKKVVGKYYYAAENFTKVCGISGNQVLYLTRQHLLNVYDFQKKVNKLVLTDKVNNAIWGPNKEIYTVLQNKLVKIIGI